MTEAPVKVGSDVQAWCTSCRDMQWHVVVAMVGTSPAKVECAHCHKQHIYRAGPPGSTKAKSGATAAARPRATKRASAGGRAKPAVRTFDVAALTAGREARLYSPATAYATGDVVRHPSFGVGVVVLLPGPQKMEVAFLDGQKLLAHGRVAASAPALARPAPRVDDGTRRVSDVPPDRPPRH